MGISEPDEKEVARSRLKALSERAAHLRAGEHFEEAETALVEALAVAEHCLGPRSAEAAGCIDQLVALLEATGRLAEAVHHSERSLTIRRQISRPGDPAMATALHNLALLYEATSRADEARALWAEAGAVLDPKEIP